MERRGDGDRYPWTMSERRMTAFMYRNQTEKSSAYACGVYVYQICGFSICEAQTDKHQIIQKRTEQKELKHLLQKEQQRKRKVTNI